MFFIYSPLQPCVAGYRPQFAAELFGYCGSQRSFYHHIGCPGWQPASRQVAQLVLGGIIFSWDCGRFLTQEQLGPYQACGYKVAGRRKRYYEGEIDSTLYTLVLPPDALRPRPTGRWHIEPWLMPCSIWFTVRAEDWRVGSSRPSKKIPSVFFWAIAR